VIRGLESREQCGTYLPVSVKDVSKTVLMIKTRRLASLKMFCLKKNLYRAVVKAVTRRFL
jgi:hypothetical protein